MGVSYTAILAIGKEFNDWDEAKNFLSKYYEFTEDDEDQIEEDGFSEWLYNHDTFDGEMLDCYSGDYMYVGYRIRCSDPIIFEESFNSSMNLWKAAFPYVEPDVIHTVRVC